MGPKPEPRSKLYDFDSIEADDELDMELARFYAKYREITKNKSEIELHNFLQDKASQNKKEYNEVVSGLLYGILTEPERGRTYFQSICFVNRDHFATLVNKLQVIASSIKFQHLRLPVREQMFWLMSELTNLSVQNVDLLYLCLMKQIRGGDLSQSNLLLCDQILKLCEIHKSFLDANRKVITIAVYTYLRVIADHRSAHVQALLQKEVRFVITLIREKWMLCITIGRDFIRVLHDLSNIPEFAQLWDDLLNHPQKISPKFKGVESILKTPTPKEFLKCRLTPDIEFKLLYIVQNLRINHYQRNLNWFVQRFLSTPESEPYYVDIIRFLVAGWYPSNQILQSDVVPRYVVIGSMLRSIKNNVVAANVKTAIIYDWLFFTPTDNIMFIEPAMLLMERSAERYPTITAMMMEFLKHSVDKYFPPLKDYMARGVACGMNTLISKGVIRSLIPIYKCPSTEPSTKEYMQALFSEFLTEDNPTGPLPSSVSMQSTQSSTPELYNILPKSQPTTPKTEATDLSDPEELDPVSKRASSRRPSAQRLFHPEDDEDAFLYGETKTRSVVSDEDMEEDQVDSEDIKMKEQPVIEDVMVPELPEEDVEEEVEPESEPEENGNGLQSHQSYWIFGNSLKQFKEACILINKAQKEGLQEEYNTQISVAKKSLKAILAVFMKMAIPAETLSSSVAPYIRNIVMANLLRHNMGLEVQKETEEMDVLEDSTKDVFDLMMMTFWGDCEDKTTRDKIIQLIASVALFKKNKSRRHIIGMRWWTFMALELEKNENEESLDPEDWFPSILSNYEELVKYVYSYEKSIMDPKEYLREYLKGDLQTLAEYSITHFNTIIPLLYQYMPSVMVGNMEILKLTVMMLLPDTMGNLTLSLHYGSFKIFGDNFDLTLLSESLSFPAYESSCLWQLLAAELQGKNKEVEIFFKNNQFIEILKTNFKNEIVPSLFSIITTIQPTTDLICTLFKIIPLNPKSIQPQVQFILATLQYWSNHNSKVFFDSLFKSSNWMIEQAEIENNQTELQTIYLTLLKTWWNQKTSSELFKNDKKLLSNLSKLGGLINFTCPKEWSPELPRKKKRSLVFDSDED